uniref:Reverse transcriptase domain-containing protein n=1 Tax=Haemonchus contortus TaxID=6289 RepID=A0A7I4Z502_HAECO
MQARKVKYDVIGLTETRRQRPLHAIFENGEELFLGTCDCREVGGVDDIVLATPNIEQAEQMLGEFDNASGKIGSQLNFTKTKCMRNGLVTVNGRNITECSSYCI